MTRQPYPSDLSTAQWRLIRPVLPAAKPGGRPRKYDPREVLDGILYANSEGCRWRALPHDYPHRETCYDFFRAYQADGTWGRLVTALRVAVRVKAGRDPTPSGSRIGSQSAKTASGGAEVGADGGKTVRGRTRHIVTGALGVLLFVRVTAANADDGETAPKLLAGLRADEFPRLAAVWADSKSRNHDLEARLGNRDRLRVEVTAKPEGQKGSKPLKTRWVVEQTFGGSVRSRRMTRDFERQAETSAAMVRVARIHRMARRVKPCRGWREFRYKRKAAA